MLQEKIDLPLGRGSQVVSIDAILVVILDMSPLPCSGTVLV